MYRCVFVASAVVIILLLLLQDSLYNSKADLSVVDPSILKHPSRVQPLGWMKPRTRLVNAGSAECPRWAVKIREGSFLKKRHFSNDFRFVYVQGIEGTGHHMWETMVKNRPGFFSHKALIRQGLISPPSLQQFNIKSENAYLNTHKRIASNLMNLNKSGTAFEFISYPAFGGKCKNSQFVDVRLLAELFEDAGIDFRIVINFRNPYKVMNSNFRRGFFTQYLQHENDPIASYVKVLEAMIYQISQLDQEFFKCFIYDQNTVPFLVDKHIDVYAGAPGYVSLNTSFALVRDTKKRSSRQQIDVAFLDNNTHFARFKVLTGFLYDKCSSRA